MARYPVPRFFRRLVIALIAIGALLLVPSREGTLTWLKEAKSSRFMDKFTGCRTLRVTFYTIPKPFTTAPGQQERAMASWMHLPLKVKIVLVPSADSDLAEMSKVAKSVGGRMEQVGLDPFGNVLQDALFTLASRNSDSDIVVVINADIILSSDFASALLHANDQFPAPERFFFVGARSDMATIPEFQGLNYTDTNYFAEFFTSKPAREAILHSYGGVDYYAWRPQGDPYVAAIGGAIPPFTYGRGKVDNWVVKQAMNNKVPVIDASLAVLALHLPHGYAGSTSGDDTPLKVNAGKVSYKNYWVSAKGDAVTLNRYVFFKYGNVTVQDGVPWSTTWRLAKCRVDGEDRPCLQRRVGEICPCEYNPYVGATLSPVQMVKNMRVCGHTLSAQSYDHAGDEEGSRLVARWRAHGKELILTGFNSGYWDMLNNLVCRFRQLGIDNYLFIAFESASLNRCRGAGLPCVPLSLPSNIHLVTGEDAAVYNSAEFRALTKLKSLQVLKYLKAGFNILWTDLDIFWFNDVRPELQAPEYSTYDILIQSNALMSEPVANSHRRINSGFYYARSNAATIAAFQEITEHALHSKVSEQPSFYTILCGDKMEYVVNGTDCFNSEIGVRTRFLDRARYPNGNNTHWEKLRWPEVGPPPGVSIIHNNWITGHDAKNERFIKAGLVQYSPQSGCFGF
ncbi:nucleotide-diphospho-sugar transferase-domain-containing protein [Cladochytrium replicatum]|nr:nucleotide-diphospho-sugar transferase-domain-containing protein [Cladochytrium replicatum]